MSLPLDQQQQQQQPPPPFAINEQSYTYHSGSGSIGPVIAVLAVITILGVIAGLIGRICAGRTVLGYGQYDYEGWIERTCGSCIDGRIDSPPVTRNANGTSGSVPTVIPVETPQQRKPAERSSQNQSETD